MRKLRRGSRAGLWAVLLCFLFGAGCVGGGLWLSGREAKESTARPQNGGIPYQKAEVEEEALAGRFYYQQIQKQEQDAYKEILQGVRENVEKIYIHEEDAQRANELFQFVLDDFPEIFWCDGNATSTAYPGVLGTEAYVVIEPGYTYEGEEKAARQAQAEEAAAACISGIQQGASDYEKIKYIYEYIIDTVDYDMEAPDNQNILSALVNRRSVCAGYARSTQYLLQRLGIYCAYVTGTARDIGGTSEEHAWNLVRCEGQYYYVDTTWGDPIFQQEEGATAERAKTYDYLCCSQKEIERTHTLAEGFQYPECLSDDLSYYRMNGMYYDTFDENACLSAIYHSVELGEASTIFKFADEALYAQAKEALTGELVKQGAQYLGSLYGLQEIQYSYEENPALNKITLYWSYE